MRPVDRYLGDIPQKNLNDISAFINRYGNHLTEEKITEITYLLISLKKNGEKWAAQVV